MFDSEDSELEEFKKDVEFVWKIKSDLKEALKHATRK